MKKFLIFTLLFFIGIQPGCKETSLFSLNKNHIISPGIAPNITSPAEGAWFARNQAVTYCWELPEDVPEENIAGYEVQFSNTQTPDGPWDPIRFFTEKSWFYGAGHQGTYEALYWRVRIVLKDGVRSEWAVSHHKVE